MSEDNLSMEIIDAVGLICPEPVMLLHAAMRRISPQDEVTLIATDPSTQRDVVKFCVFLGHVLLVNKQCDGKFFYRIKKRQPTAALSEG